MNPVPERAANGSPPVRTSDAARVLDGLFRIEGPRLLRYFRRRARPGEDVRDLVQEAFVRLAAAIGDAPPSRPAAYLQRIARNMLIDRSRRGDTTGCHITTELSARPEQEDTLILEDLLAIYEAALDALPDRTRMTFSLHRNEGLTYREIGETLGISVPAVQKHMAKALERIAWALQDRE